MPSEPSTAPSARLIDLLVPPGPAAPPAAEAAASERVLWEPFVARAQAHPDRPAIAGPTYGISYGRLLDASLRVARALADAGAGPEAPVAVYMPKGWEQVASALGVQFAGAAYLPVPVDWPALRVADLIRDTGARVAVTAGEDAARALPGSLAVVRFGACDSPASLGEVRRRRAPGDLAYVIPTSGTTGTPKAVMVEHGAAWTTIEAINRMFGVSEDDRVLGLSALAFDLSVWDIFGLLAAGGALVLPDARRLRDPEHWVDLCRAHGVTIWNSVPALARMLVQAGVPGGGALARCPSLRLMLLSGDWIPLALARQVRQERPDVELVSLGGATEASIWSIVHRVDGIDPSWKSIPYGRPLPGQSMVVLDESLESLPPWAEGELYIGGAGLARGYWRDDALTRERFVRHPRTGERLYRTGDLGRTWPDGTIELVGRIDSQVKISGHRVELSEIETHLQALPGVRAGVVSHRPIGRHGRTALVGYVVLDDTARPPEGPVTDPLDRLGFKLQEHGVRRVTGQAGAVPLAMPATDVFAAAFRARRTHRAFRPEPVARESLDALLAHLVQLALDGFPLPKRLYPSAGSLYPVQAYLHVRPGRVEGLEGGGYYCDPRARVLRALSPGADLAPACFGGVNLRAAEQAAFSIFLVGELAAIAPMYPEQAREFCLLEAGYMGQLLMTSAAEVGLGLCPIGGIEGEEWRGCLRLGDSHVFLHALVGGIPAEEGRGARVDGSLAAAGIADLQRALDDAGFRRDARRAAALRELRAELGTRLPAHMIPGAWVVLDSLPLTENGKVDRNNLPEPGADDAPGLDDEQTTPTEARLLALWREFLGGGAIAVDQGFFEAGGDSLLLLDVQAQLQQEFGIEVPLAHLFQYASIRSLARWLDQALEAGGSLPAADAQATGYDSTRSRVSPG